MGRRAADRALRRERLDRARPATRSKYEWDLDGDGEFDDGHDLADAEGHLHRRDSENVAVAVRVKDAHDRQNLDRQPDRLPGRLAAAVDDRRAGTDPHLGRRPTDRIRRLRRSRRNKERRGRHAGRKTATGRCACCTARSKRRTATNIRSQVFPGVEEGHDRRSRPPYPAFVNFIFSATDARGLSAETSVKVEARPVPLQIHSEPPGIEIGVGETNVIDARTNTSRSKARAPPSRPRTKP